MQYHAIPCNTMQYHAIPYNTMQCHASLITADGAHHCPLGTGGGVLFQAGVLFSKENAKFWPILTSFGALFGVIFTGPKSAVVYQNWQISGMVPAMSKTNPKPLFPGCRIVPSCHPGWGAVSDLGGSFAERGFKIGHRHSGTTTRAI